MKKTGMILLASCAVAVASSLTTAFVMRAAGGSHDEDNFYSAQSEPRDGGNFYTVGSVTTPATDFTSAAESTVNGVVSIKSYATPRSQMGQGGGGYDPFYEFFFGTPSPRQQPRRQQQQPQQLGLGSGVILSEDGYIVTNNHVVEGAEMLEVTLNDNRSFNATVIGTDPSTDLALVKIEADSLHVIPIGDSEGLKVGEWVLAVGNPFGFTSTVTTGIVSAKGRNISSITRSGNTGIESYIQTDAAVNPGNSGGALLNSKGEVIGINSSKIGGSTIEGMGYAIPISDARPIIEDLMTKQTRLKVAEEDRGYLGITGVDVTSDSVQLYGLPRGVYVSSVTDGSGAAQAGLVRGDIITAINGEEVSSMVELKEELAYYAAGTTVELTIMQGSPTGYQAKTVSLTLGRSTQ